MNDIDLGKGASPYERTKTLSEIAKRIQETSVVIQNSTATAHARADELRSKKGFRNVWDNVWGKNKILRDDMNRNVVAGQQSISQLTELVNLNVTTTTQLFEDFGQEVFTAIEETRAATDARADELSGVMIQLGTITTSHNEELVKIRSELKSINSRLSLLAVFSFVLGAAALASAIYAILK